MSLKEEKKKKLKEEKDFDVKETEYLCSIPGMKESILEGMKEKKEDCSENLEELK